MCNYLHIKMYVRSFSAIHEEAGKRKILHVDEAYKQGYERMVVVCRVSDVLLLLIHFADELGEEVWFKSGTAKDRYFIPVRKVQLPHLHVFHAISCCYEVSQFYGIGNKLTVGSLTSNTYKEVENLFVICTHHQ